ncbi:HisA/HisF-related TIM barrel protein, partial [Klebsiella pneumoniae]|uniref:HisA/HisF-related TIM barrel protein n=1 Tax=Klebsiella pneumoniae TaxID=573 RepID=UPI003A80E041
NKDGMLKGPNLDLLREVCARTDRPVVASGGVSTLADIEAIRQQLACPDCRLLTLAGSAGIGKTRLAAEVARRISAQYAQGVFWIDLAPLRQPDEILLALAAALNLAVQTGNHT